MDDVFFLFSVENSNATQTLSTQNTKCMWTLRLNLSQRLQFDSAKFISVNQKVVATTCTSFSCSGLRIQRALVQHAENFPWSFVLFPPIGAVIFLQFEQHLRQEAHDLNGQNYSLLASEWNLFQLSVGCVWQMHPIHLHWLLSTITVDEVLTILAAARFLCEVCCRSPQRSIHDAWPQGHCNLVSHPLALCIFKFHQQKASRRDYSLIKSKYSHIFSNSSSMFHSKWADNGT